MDRFKLLLHVHAGGGPPGRKLHKRRVEKPSKNNSAAPVHTVKPAKTKSATGHSIQLNLGFGTPKWLLHHEPRFLRKHLASSHSVIGFKAIRYPQDNIVILPSVHDAEGDTREAAAAAAGPATSNSIVPELNHLARGLHRSRAICVRPQRSRGRMLIPTNNHNNIDHSDSQSKMRQQAKTPVHAIGQLERTSVVVTSSSSPRYSTATTVDIDRDTNHCHQYHQLRHKAASPALRPAPRNALVARSARRTPRGENLGLQICLDLLARELSAGTMRLQQRAGSAGASELELWLMIEAYERLRDELLEQRPHSQQEMDELAVVRTMFDIWLRALHKVHREIGLLAQRSAVFREVGMEEVDV